PGVDDPRSHEAPIARTKDAVLHTLGVLYVERRRGGMTEWWMNGQKWRWYRSAGNDSAVRIGGDGLHYGLPQGGAIPPAVHVLRNAIFWAATSGVPDSEGSIRSSAVIWNGKPTTCLLFGSRGEDPQGARTWDEDEFCIRSEER